MTDEIIYPPSHFICLTQISTNATVRIPYHNIEKIFDPLPSGKSKTAKGALVFLSTSEDSIHVIESPDEVEKQCVQAKFICENWITPEGEDEEAS